MEKARPVKVGKLTFLRAHFKERLLKVIVVISVKFLFCLVYRKVQFLLHYSLFVISMTSHHWLCYFIT